MPSPGWRKVNFRVRLRLKPESISDTIKLSTRKAKIQTFGDRGRLDRCAARLARHCFRRDAEKGDRDGRAPQKLLRIEIGVRIDWFDCKF